MQVNQAWIGLFRRIPADLEDSVALGMTTGSEIVVQKFVKFEPDFMIIRGRLAGTQDSGRIVMIPYSQLTFVALQKPLMDTEVEAIFGKAEQASETPPAQVAEAPSPAAAPEVAPPAEPAVVKPTPPPVIVQKPDPASKTVLLAKLRDRLKEK
jgi:hypothetical protein